MNSLFSLRSAFASGLHSLVVGLGAVALVAGVGCGQEERTINDPRWLSDAMGQAVGAHFHVAHDDEDALRVLNALGYAHRAEGHYERKVDLSAHTALVPSDMPSLQSIDAIAVITVYRPFLGEQQYAYATLRSLLRELPQEAQINMMVGNALVDYLSADRLANEIGADNVGRIHVHPTSADIAQFFEDEPIGVATRATWNFARALRGYRGTRHLMLLEDDISLAQGSMAALHPYLEAPEAPVFTLFNDRCGSIPVTQQLPASALAVAATPMRRNSDFPTTQATLFSSGVANAAGRYIATRAGRESYDYMLGRFFAQTQSALGYIRPSIVQHEGRSSTGLSGPNNVPYSACYVDVVQAEVAEPQPQP